MNGYVLLLGALGLLGAVVFLIVVPPRTVRGWALVSTIAVTTVAGNNSVPREIWVPAFAFCAVLLCIAIGRVRLRRPPLRSAFTVMAAWWAFLALGILVNGSYSLPRMVAYFGLAVLIALVASQLTARERVLVLRAVVVVAAVESLWAAVELVAHLTPLWGYRGDYVRTNPLFGDSIARAQGSMGHPIVLGMITGIGVLLVWTNRVGFRPGVRAAAFVVCGGGVVLSGTRSVLLALVVAVVVHLLLRGRLAAWLRNTVLVAVAATVVVLLNFGISRLVDELVASGSWVHRIGSIAAVPDLLARPLGQSLWGSGFGSEVSLFTHGYIPSTYGLQVVDDFLVYLLGTTGIVGLAGFLAITVWAFVRADRQGRALVVFFVLMFLSFDVLVWTYAGLVLTMFYVLPPEARVPSRPEPRTDAAAPPALVGARSR